MQRQRACADACVRSVHGIHVRVWRLGMIARVLPFISRQLDRLVLQNYSAVIGKAAGVSAQSLMVQGIPAHCFNLELQFTLQDGSALSFKRAFLVKTKDEYIILTPHVGYYLVPKKAVVQMDMLPAR